MIGSRCKRREALSRAVLIGRALPSLTQVSRGRATFCPRTRCAVRPPGHRARPGPLQPNAPRWSATMAGEVHPVPFRTRKLSPLAPMVLRSSPWESRTSLTNEGHLRAGRAPSPAWWRGPLAYGGASDAVRPVFRGCRLCHLRTFPPGGWHVSLGYSLRLCLPGWFRAVWSLKGNAPYKTNKNASPSGSMVRRFCFLGPCVRYLPLTPFGHLARRRERRRCRRLFFRMGKRYSCGARRLAWNLASYLPAACDQVLNKGATYYVGPLCVVLSYFDEMHCLCS